MIFEVVVESDEVLQFIGVFEEISFDDEAEELDEHEVFGIDFANGAVDLLEEFLVEGGSVLYLLLLGELERQSGSAHLLCLIYNFYGNVIKH